MSSAKRKDNFFIINTLSQIEPEEAFDYFLNELKRYSYLTGFSDESLKVLLTIYEEDPAPDEKGLYMLDRLLMNNKVPETVFSSFVEESKGYPIRCYAMFCSVNATNKTRDSVIEYLLSKEGREHMPAFLEQFNESGATWKLIEPYKVFIDHLYE